MNGKRIKLNDNKLFLKDDEIFFLILQLFFEKWYLVLIIKNIIEEYENKTFRKLYDFFKRMEAETRVKRGQVGKKDKIARDNPHNPS